MVTWPCHSMLMEQAQLLPMRSILGEEAMVGQYAPLDSRIIEMP